MSVQTNRLKVQSTSAGLRRMLLSDPYQAHRWRSTKYSKCSLQGSQCFVNGPQRHAEQDQHAPTCLGVDMYTEAYTALPAISTSTRSTHMFKCYGQGMHSLA